MSGKRIVMWRVPKEHWQTEDNGTTAITPFVRDALDIEHRLPKGINLANERMRYHLCCRRIQNAVLEGRLADAHEPLEADIIPLFHEQAIKANPALLASRFAACFFPPEHVGKAIEGMEAFASSRPTGLAAAGLASLSKRLYFFRRAKDDAAGIVETFDFLSDKMEDFDVLEPESIFVEEEEQQHPSRDGYVAVHAEQGLTAYQNLLDTVEQAIQNDSAVNFSNQPHNVITEVLNRIVYAEDGQKPAMIRVVYMDGTEAAPFPVRCLQRKTSAPPQDKTIRLRAALVSMRHLEMDSQVDLAWFRNRQVSAGESYAGVDAFCTEQTLNQLQDMPREQTVVLSLYQTGLETAVIGFYRGLVHYLLERQNDGPSIQVLPMYYKGKTDGYEEGKIWA